MLNLRPSELIRIVSLAKSDNSRLKDREKKNPEQMKSLRKVSREGIRVI